MSIRRLVLPAARAMARWHALRTVDVPALNATLKAAGLPAITTGSAAQSTAGPARQWRASVTAKASRGRVTANGAAPPAAQGRQP